jgi:hypothetical protein
MLRNQTNQVKSYLSVFLVKAKFLIDFVEHMITRYKEQSEIVQSHYIMLKMSIIETMQAQNSQMSPVTPKRERSEKGLGDLSSFGFALNNYKTTD